MKTAFQIKTDQRHGPSAVHHDAQPTAAAVIVDNRPEAIAQRQLGEAIDQSPQATAQRALIANIHNSPTMVAQRKQLSSMLGEAAQLESGPEEEELLQGKFETVQRKGLEEEEPLQGKFAPTQLKEDEGSQRNNTGLPGNLKSGIENLSGMSMDNVKVHYNSPQPAQFNASAYAQGTDIHVASGQEQHLPHEAWHVVQQSQGRVKPTMQAKGVAINDDANLEHEADVMGGRALQMRRAGRSAFEMPAHSRRFDSIIQRHHMYGKAKLTDGTQDAAEIYRVIEKASGNVVYVGQTCNQVGYKSRFEQHLTSGYHPGWSHGTHRVERIEAGNWTLLETFISEQYWIDHYGFDNLENGANALTLAKFLQYRDDNVTTPTLKGEFRPQQ